MQILSIQKFFLFSLCAIFVGVPFLVFSQEVSAPETETAQTEIPSEPEVEVVEENTTESITAEPEAITQEETPSEPETISETIQESEPEILDESASEPTSEPLVDEPETENKPVPVLEEEPIKETPLSELTRVYTKEIFINKDARHKCNVEFFKVDMSERNSALNTIIITREADISYEIEIGSLPIGIDIKFTENDSYYKNLGSTDESIDISIKKNSNAKNGSFSVPIIYTQKGVFDSSVICQLNVIN